MLAKKQPVPVERPERKPVFVSGKWYYLYWGAGICVSVAMILYGIFHNQLETVFNAGGYL